MDGWSEAVVRGILGVYGDGAFPDGSGMYVTRSVSLPGDRFVDAAVAHVLALGTHPDGGMAAVEARVVTGPGFASRVREALSVRRDPRADLGGTGVGLRTPAAAGGHGGEATSRCFGVALAMALNGIPGADALVHPARLPRRVRDRNLASRGVVATEAEIVEADRRRRVARDVALSAMVSDMEPVALAILRHLGFHDWSWPGHMGTAPLSRAMGEAWHGDANAFDAGSPLGEALRRHPSMPGTVMAAWLRDPVAFAADARDGRPDAPMLRALADDGHMPGRAAAGPVARFGMAAMSAACAYVAGVRPGSWHMLPRRMPGGGLVDAPLGLLATLHGLPRAWVPGTPAEWHALAGLSATVGKAAALCAGRAGLPAFVDAGRGWQALSGRLSRAAGGVDVDVGMDGMADMARAFADQVLVPAAALAADGDGDACGGMARVAHRILFDGRALARCLSMSADWHRRAARMRADAAALPGTVAVTAWPAALPGHADGDLSLVHLTDRLMLVAEGCDGPDGDGVDGLGHCVGGYADRCLDGVSRIASVRRRHPDGTVTRVSTVEFGFDGKTPSVEQHLGPRNADLGPAAASFVAAYLDLLRADPSSVDLAGLDTVARPDASVESAGYDWREPGNWDAVRRFWDRYLPRPNRSLDPFAMAALADAVLVDGGPPGPDGTGDFDWRPTAVHSLPRAEDAAPSYAAPSFTHR